MRRTSIIGSVVLVALVGCSGIQRDRSSGTASTGVGCCRSAETPPSRTAIVRTAARLVGARTIDVKGQRIAYDCAGVTRAVFLQHGIDLYESRMTGQQANGVRLIYHHIREHGKLHQGPAARPGDLVFFDNTWDANRDRRINDRLTHVGIVERQDADGTITFISRVAGAVERYRMNLGLPHVYRTAEGKVLNDHIRRKDSDDGPTTRYLTGELFAAFGTRTDL
jgi:hypothetical protein